MSSSEDLQDIRLGLWGRYSLIGPHQVRFDVTGALPADAVAGRTILISCWLFFREDVESLAQTTTAMVLTAGGSYDKRYHHAVIAGHPGYSAAQYLAELGNVVLLADHLGVGLSDKLADQKKATRDVVALANHVAASQFYDRLSNGTLHPLLPPIPNFVRIGGGHSMGGMQTILQQANHQTYDGVMIMGYTAEGVHLTLNGRKVRAAELIPAGDPPDYSHGDRKPMHEVFHWEDVPPEVVAADDALAVDTPSNIGLDSIRTRVVYEEAGRIDVPVYICLGERDVAPQPHLEPSYYRASPDITLHILPRSGHCQTFASTRHQMWNRMHSWSRWVASSKEAPGKL